MSCLLLTPAPGTAQGATRKSKSLVALALSLSAPAVVLGGANHQSLPTINNQNDGSYLFIIKERMKCRIDCLRPRRGLRREHERNLSAPAALALSGGTDPEPGEGCCPVDEAPDGANHQSLPTIDNRNDGGCLFIIKE